MKSHVLLANKPIKCHIKWDGFNKSSGVAGVVSKNFKKQTNTSYWAIQSTSTKIL